MTRTANELAEFLGCALEGDGLAQLSWVAAPASALADDLIYVETPRHLDRAAASRANCALIAPGLALAGKTLLRAANPKLAFARAAAWLLPPTPIATGIHPTAVIAPSAQLAGGVAVGPYAVIEEEVKIGAGTEIGAFCFLGRDVRLGEGCRLYPRVTLYAGARLANRVILHSGAVIGSDGFGYVAAEGKRWKFPQVGEVEIGDDVEIGANTTIDRGSLDRTEILAGVKLDNLVHIAHNVRIGENTVIAAQTGISGSAMIGKGCGLRRPGRFGRPLRDRRRRRGRRASRHTARQDRSQRTDRLGHPGAAPGEVQGAIRLVRALAGAGGTRPKA